MSEQLPKFKNTQFKCPHCQVIAQQQWFDEQSASKTVIQIIKHLYYDYRMRTQDYQQKAIESFVKTITEEFSKGYRKFIPSKFAISTCEACGDLSLWVDQKIVYPKKITIAPPNCDLNEDIRALYHEAASIYADSPKGATALLRLALQKLLIQVGKDGKNINNDIKELVAGGLSPKIQQALDLLGVIGNNAVHPGQINLDDNSAIALKLFHILNFIADEMITKPKELELLYADIIPENTKDHINQRDGRNTLSKAKLIVRD